ncbi:scoloptoxin SSD14-like [Dermacentor andersoni]|uniref:scoloptoxin SSD14-like n=1 Tax=Dermacentor andersoni TaxID=34620 RepID=UPI003B3A84A3
MVGFRPALSTQGVIQLIKRQIIDDDTSDTLGILDLDLSKPFDNISHRFVLDAISDLGLGPRFHASRRLPATRGHGSCVVTFAAVFLLLTTATVLYLRIPVQQRSLRGKRPISNAPLGSFSSWAAIVGHERCNHVPRKIFIEMNGTAADAAVASMLCVCVVLSHACGLGGGFFALHYKNKTPSEVKFVDAWETAPLQASEAHYVAYHNDTIFGVRSAAVPGQVSGFRELLDAGGSRLPWAVLFEEAIKVASQGAPVTTEMARQLARRRAHVLANPALRSLYTKKGLDTLVGPEDVVVNEPLARTLQILAAKGSADFYTGSVAADLLRDVRTSDGLLTEQDLAEYRARVGNATAMQLGRVMTVWSAPPPSSGIVVSFILALINRCDDVAVSSLLFCCFIYLFNSE